MINDVLFVLPQQFENHPKAVSKEVIVDASCGTAVLRGADIFVPGVLAANSSTYNYHEAFLSQIKSKYKLFEFLSCLSRILISEN